MFLCCCCGCIREHWHTVVLSDCESDHILKGWEFALLIFHSALFHFHQSLKKSNCERVALFTLYKRVTMSISISSFFKKSDCERIANVSKCRKCQQMSQMSAARDYFVIIVLLLLKMRLLGLSSQGWAPRSFPFWRHRSFAFF